MDYRLLLLTLLLLAVAEGQSTTPSALTTEADSVTDQKSTKESQSSTKEEENSTKKVEISTKETQNSTQEVENSTKEAQKSTQEVENSTKESQNPGKEVEDSTKESPNPGKEVENSTKESQNPGKEVENSTKEGKGAETGQPEVPEPDLAVLESMSIPFTQVTKEQSEPGDDSGMLPKELEKEMETYMELEKEEEKVSKDSGTTKSDSTTDDKKDVDSDEYDESEDDDDESDEEEEESTPKAKKVPVLVTNPETILIRRQGIISPESERDETNEENSPLTEEVSDTRESAPVYLPAGEQAAPPEDKLNDGSLLLYLTEGGYGDPYQKSRIRPESESEAVETPSASIINGEEAREPSLMPKVPYMAPYQPQINFGARPAFPHPLDTAGAFGAGGMLQGGLQNGFFNTPPAGFTDFTTANFQSQLHPSDSVDFSALSRDQGGISLFQTPPRQNPGHLFQNTPQYLQAQRIPDAFQRPVHSLYQPGSFSNYPSLDNVENMPRPNYYPFLRHPAMNPQFQANPNFYATLRNSGSNDFNNPGINAQSNYPLNGDTQSLPPQFLRFPVPDVQMTVKSSDQVEKQKQESNDEVEKQKQGGDPAEEQKSKDTDTMKVSQDKEDPEILPFGARILEQNNAPGQNVFSTPKDVYLRYPMREAGYATEENLPLQNSTEKTTRNNDPLPARTPFPFFTSLGDFTPFSSPDPYRNALIKLQQNYPIDNNNENTDDSNRTGDFPVNQFTQNIPLSFEANPAQPPNQVFTSYPQRSQVLPMFQSRPFYPIPGLERARNPFDLEAGIPENNYRFASPESAGTPVCAQESNASLCFEDPEYPQRELMYALNSAPYLMDRLSGPNEVDEDIALVDQSTLENPESEDNYICKADIKYGLPLRAKNSKGAWKVIVNMERESRMPKQRVRLEVCRSANEPCSLTEAKTACVQKYSLQRLLSWSREKGAHHDVYKLPIACSCQILAA